jgi:hypothetical protein
LVDYSLAALRFSLLHSSRSSDVEVGFLNAESETQIHNRPINDGPQHQASAGGRITS